MDDRRSHEEEQHHGGAWKVAYADFVTALMALFIVLWLLSAGPKVREAVGGYFKDPHGHHELSGSARAGSGESLAVDKKNVDKLRERLQQAMHQRPEFQQFEKNVKFTVTGEGLRIEMLENNGGLFFDNGSSRPTSNGAHLFELLAKQMGSLPNTIAIEGHTDARAFHSQGPDSYGNWELSFDRANAARRIMLASGLHPEQVSEIRGYADRSNLAGADPDDSRNRRVSVIMKYLGK